jgi:hypothetical protein
MIHNITGEQVLGAIALIAVVFAIDWLYRKDL